MAYSDVILAEASVQSYWRVNELSGNFIDGPGIIDGTVDPLVTRGVTGLISNDPDLACSVNRADGAGVVFGNNHGFAGTVSFSVEIWFKPSLVDGTVGIIAGKEVIGGSGWRLDYFNGATRFHRFDSAGVGDTAAGAVMTAGTSYHLVGTYDGSNVRLYMNNGTPATTASTRSITAVANFLSLGRYSEGGSGSSGTLDEYAIYNAALSATAVSNHYEAAQANAPLLRPIASPLRW